MLLLGLVEVELEALSHRAFALQLLHDLLAVLCQLLLARAMFLRFRVAGVVEVRQLLKVGFELGDFLLRILANSEVRTRE